jgi:6-pyruvoyltetrahydropterin/6-carboxytetrahydropterin synthase
MYKVSKEFHFSASHYLYGLPEEHLCSRIHGHNYIIIVELSAIKLNDIGFVTDYRALEPIKTYIDEVLDHKHLNDVFSFNSTAENMAKYIFTLFKPQFPNLSAVKVCETPKTIATYTPDYDG